MLADEKSRQLKVFCPLCNNVYRVPHIASCGVSDYGIIKCTIVQKHVNGSLGLRH